MLPLALSLSITGLFVGPTLAALGRGRTLATTTLDALTLALIPAVVLLRLLPDLWPQLGAMTMVLMGAGYQLAALADRGGHDDATPATSLSGFAPALIFGALFLHALTDGATIALALADEKLRAHGAVIAGSLLLHRLPEGLFVATLYAPRIGLWRTMGRIALLGVATLIGALLGRLVVGHATESVLAVLVAIGLGGMLRLSIHSHAPMPSSLNERGVAGLVFLGGVAVVVGLPDPDRVLRASDVAGPQIAASIAATFVAAGPLVVAIFVAVWVGLAAIGKGDAAHLAGPLEAVSSGSAIAIVVVAIVDATVGHHAPRLHTLIARLPNGFAIACAPIAAMIVVIPIVWLGPRAWLGAVQRVIVRPRA